MRNTERAGDDESDDDQLPAECVDAVCQRLADSARPEDTPEHAACASDEDNGADRTKRTVHNLLDCAAGLFAAQKPHGHDDGDRQCHRRRTDHLQEAEGNHYSVPVAYGHQDVWVRGYVNEVVIGCRGEIIARHPRCWEREDVVFDPVHYLPLIEQKINSLDQAAPLQGWDLPQEFATLRRLMEGRMAKHGRREYVQVLRLLESFELADLHAAVKQAIQLGAIGFDAVKHLILCRVERRPPRLDLSIYPYLPRATVETTSAKAYMRLLSSDAGEAA